VQSWRQFSAYFGDFTGAAYLAYAARGFFENGGRRCWVVRVGSEIAATAAATFTGIWRIAASSPGVWGNDLEVSIRETRRAQTLTDPRAGTPESFAVASVTGFARGTHVRLTQDANAIYGVVEDVDAIESRLIWQHRKPELRLPYYQPLVSALSAFDATRPMLVESVEYTLLVRRTRTPHARS
jgi:hypothetical protein